MRGTGITISDDERLYYGSNISQAPIKANKGSFFIVTDNGLESGNIIDTYIFTKVWEKIGGGASQGDYIPLTGTTEGNPVTGDIEIFNIENSDEKRIIGVNSDTYFDEYGERNIIGSDNKGFNIRTDNISGIGPEKVGIYSGIDFSDREPENKKIYTQRSYVDKANSYSTTETQTGGTWIDGKPIYRKTKVFSGADLVSNGLIDLTVAFPNMESIIKNPDVFTDWTTDNGLKMAGTLFQDVMYIIYPDVLSARIPFSLNSFDVSVFDSITLTFEYTKTTD